MKKPFFNLITMFMSCLLVLMMYPVQPALAAAEESRLSQKNFSEPEELLVPNNYTVAVFNGAVGYEDGKPVMYATSKGKPGYLNVIDLEEYKLLRTISLAPSESSWAHTVAPNGTLYVAAEGSGARLWEYSPVTHKAVQVAEFEGQSVSNSITTDEQGRVYVGTYPGGKVWQYDPATKQVRDYGRVISALDQEYVRSIAYQGGYIYAGTAHEQIVRVDLNTGEKTNIAASLTVKNDTVYDLSTIDNRYLFARYTDGSGIPGEGYIYDTATGSWLDVELQQVTGLHATDSVDGKLYYMSEKKLKTFDLAAHQVEETGMTYESGFRGADWVEFKNNPELPEKTLVTVRYDGGVAMLNIDTKKVIVKPPIIPGLPGVVNRLQSVSDTQLITTGSQARSSLVDLETMTAKPFSIGQADSVYPIGNKVYMGVYPEGGLYVYDLNQEPGSTNPQRLAVLGNDQERLVHMSEGDGKLFISTISGYGTLGGSLTVHDTATGETKVHRNVVQNQSVLSTAYVDGKIFGSTTIRGGLGSTPSEQEAKIFVWDVQKEQKITEFTLGIPELIDPIFIGDLSLGPDGLIWGASYEYIFAIDPETYKLVKYKKIYPKLYYTQWHHHPMHWSEDGLLYVLFNNKLTVIDPETLEFRTLTDALRFDLGRDGNLYFTDLATNTVLYSINIDGEIVPEPPGLPLPVNNAGVEQAPEGSGKLPGWTSMFATSGDAYFERSGDKSYAGDYSLQTTDLIRTASVAVQSDPIALSPGKVYSASAQIYIESGQPGFMFRFYNTEGQTLSTLETHLDESRLQEWRKVTLRGRAPEGAAYARVIAVTSRYNISSAYYDNFSVSVMDNTAPLTEVAFNPQPNEQGWHNEDVSITLNSEGAASLFYETKGAERMDQREAAGSSTEFTVSAEGVTAVTYWAESVYGVPGVPSTTELKIDKTAPVIEFSGESVYEVDDVIRIECSAQDALSGIAKSDCDAVLADNPAYLTGIGVYLVNASVSDIAGNSVKSSFSYEVILTYEGIAGLIDKFLSHDPKLAEQLKDQLMKAQRADESGNEGGKKGAKSGFVNQVEAMSGKGLAKEHAELLVQFGSRI
ncbi:PQQ-binding-like beta-propeller repeat protein [Paenibacillus albidus]|uniref:PQQ-binding-like beta-propeller repeat protein n=1 Tax=Paenibacillus albidus TaxID=2041023 RepID=UPI001BE73436|nr:PQQ-binding-like beta-propeller repeat protein [Paenibacillus albidus]MBT2289230.1 PQQ-binding-like beta-propeller repeat protein [Paenibacillus albidus]